MHKIDVVVIGHILNEKIIFPDKEVYPVLGSPAAYSSVCMASLGVKVGVVTKIGKDFPHELLKVFSEMNIDISGISFSERSTKNELIYDKNGNKTLKFVSKAEDIRFQDIPESYLSAEIFYVCPMDYEVDIKTIEKISTLGKTMAVDLGGYGGGTSDTHPVEKNGSEIKELCSYFNIVKASIEDYSHIMDAKVGDEMIISEKIIQWGADVSIVTLGEKGSFIRAGDEELYVPSFPSERIVDPTGAGDCYCAGFLAKYLKSRDPFISAIYGAATTSYVIERSGGVVSSRMPTLKEVEIRVEKLKSVMDAEKVSRW